MKERKPRTATLQEVAKVRFNKDGEAVTVDLTLRAVRNVETGQIRVDVTIPNADQLVYPSDLGVLLQCFGWGMASMGVKLGGDPHLIWHDCCDLIWKVEYCLRLD